MSAVEEDPSQEAERLKHRTDVLREDLDGIVGELDRRRHRFTRRLGPIALVAAGVAVAGGVGLLLWRRHQRRARPKLAPFVEAIRQMSAHPERIARESPSVANRVAAAALTTLTTLAIRRAFAAMLPERERNA